ncbi:hypothetical protein PEL8287_00551 [Roseovarius litorisediminis]|uniref:Uncharacterized protein n=1 Tax=Roseovarius litorisediminis TaxID=1312363 RepID=A0A1Y5RDJ0_9RHOB|nr:hypothetical protein PEL8287_00551 [Roseovarius litorisediminis]
MKSKSGPVFLERRTYRRRRMIDAARLLPVLGIILVSIPLLWNGTPDPHTRTTYAMFYLFVVWIILVALSAIISRYLGPNESDEQSLGDR